MLITACAFIFSLQNPHHGFRFVGTALSMYVIIASIIFTNFSSSCFDKRFGLPNLITLFRSSIICLLAGYIASPCKILEIPFGLAILALSLDGIDGWLARRLRQSSRFGARFDLEVDALFVLILSMLVWQLHKLPMWVLTIGFMRYLFLLFAKFVPWLRQPLPPRLRRKIIGNIQVISLIFCIDPLLLGAAISWIAWILASALLLLVFSFFSDVYWQYKHSRLQNHWRILK